MGLFIYEEKHLEWLLIKPNTRYNEIEESTIGEVLNEKDMWNISNRFIAS